MTNRELIKIAMPLFSLTNEQWDIIEKHLQKISSESGTNSLLFKTLDLLFRNQCRIEISANYNEYYFDKLDEEIRGESTCIQVI